MMTSKIKILGISGSLRPISSAGAVLSIIGDWIPDNVDFKIFGGLGDIPAFDDSHPLPAPVIEFIRQISDADAVLFCIPEYAFGVPGALKNALDWTVSSTAFSDKPVALITAASNGERAHASMALTLGALGSIISEQTKLLIPYIKTKLDEKGQLTDGNVLNSIKRVIHVLLQTVEANIVTSR
jgi:NAD(P)H-dependent FMN reductase